MKFEKTINISDVDIIQTIRDTYNNDKRYNFIMKILPDDMYGDIDLDFIFNIVISLNNILVRETKSLDIGMDSELKKINKDIQKLHKKLDWIGEDYDTSRI